MISCRTLKLCFSFHKQKLSSTIQDKRNEHKITSNVQHPLASSEKRTRCYAFKMGTRRSSHYNRPTSASNECNRLFNIMHNNFIKMPTDGTHILSDCCSHISHCKRKTVNPSLYQFGPHSSITLPANIGSMWKMRHTLKKWPPECSPLHVLMTSHTDAWPVLNVFESAATYVCLVSKYSVQSLLCLAHTRFSIRTSEYEIKIS